MHFHSFPQSIALSTFPLNFYGTVVLLDLRFKVFPLEYLLDLLVYLSFAVDFRRIPKQLNRQGGCSS